MDIVVHLHSLISLIMGLKSLTMKRTCSLPTPQI